MTREEIGLALDVERREVADLWERVTLGPYTLMRQGECVLLIDGNMVLWSLAETKTSSNLSVERRNTAYSLLDQRQPNFD